MIPTPPDAFDEWYNAHLSVPDVEDPRFTFWRATPEHWERIWDVVDQAFDKKRPREVYDWLYRRNPYGRARCWVLQHRETGEYVKTSATFPWPVWRGREEMPGGVGGDAATLPQWQRQGLSAIRRPVSRSHPWYGKRIGIAGPNEKSRGVSAKADRTETLLGFLPGGVRPLRSAPLLERSRVPGPLARASGAVGDALFSAWDGILARSARRAPGQIEEVSRFDTAFDEVTERHMAFPLYWCPHNAAFLNWRYLEHPGETYVAFALVEDERPTGYAVVRLAGNGATLAELCAARSPRDGAARLLLHALGVARQAGCAYMNFFATPSFPHWRLLHRAGFLPYKTNNFFEGGGRDWEPEVTSLDNWQAGPGDRDYH